MSFLKSNLFKHGCHLPTFQEHGHSLPTFLIRGHYFDYFTHIQTTWAFRAHVFKKATYHIFMAEQK